MATTDEAEVASGLFDHLQLLSTTPATAIAWPNIAFDPAGVYPYLRVDLIETPAGRQTESGDMKRHNGILQVSIVEERGAGDLRTKRIAGQLIDHFKQSQLIWNDDRAIQILEPGVASAPFVVENEMVTPVQFRYTSFSSVSA